MSGPVPLGSNIVVRSPNWLGDAIMTLPALAYLQRAVPSGTSISVLCPANLLPFWQTVPNITKVLPLPPNLWIAADLLKSQHFSSAFIFPNSLRTGVEIFLAKIPLRLGYPGHHRSAFLTHRFIKPKTLVPEHQLWHYLRLVCQALGQETPTVPEVPHLNIKESSSPEKPFLVLCPGAEYGPAKRWPADRFAQVANLLAEEENLDLVLLGGPRDEETCAWVAQRLSRPSRNLAGKTSLDQFICLLAQARLVLCNDSGAMHLAALLRAPTVAIFGSTEPRSTGPLSDSVAVLREHVPCSPCFLRECPIDFRCMNAITLDMVLQASRKVANLSARP